MDRWCIEWLGEEDCSQPMRTIWFRKCSQPSRARSRIGSRSLIADDSGRFKRFKFRLEKIDVTDQYEIAERFWLLYRGQGNPRISGVWGDPRTNSLIIIGPPEADQGIRDTLADWEGATSGIEFGVDESLESQQKLFQHHRRSMLEQVASDKLKIIEAEAAGEKADGEKLKQLNRDLKRDTAELEVVESKLQVITETIERLQDRESRNG